MTLGHVLISLLMLAVGDPLIGLWPAVAFIAGWFWSREKAQYDAKAKSPGASNATVWYRGLWPGDWTPQSRWDALAPTAAVLIVAAFGRFFS